MPEGPKKWARQQWAEEERVGPKKSADFKKGKKTKIDEAVAQKIQLKMKAALTGITAEKFFAR